jgi:hypothetical protein
MDQTPRSEKRVHAVVTGRPEVQLLACTECGVLLWDIDAHYAHAHPQSKTSVRRAPVQSPRGSISWDEHMEAHRAYRARYGNQQDAERIAYRGGFGFKELRMFLGRDPVTFVPEAPRDGSFGAFCVQSRPDQPEPAGTRRNRAPVRPMQQRNRRSQPELPEQENTMSAQTYRKKPVAIKAMQYGEDDPIALTQWMEANLYPFLRGDATKPETLRYPDQAKGDDSKPDKGIYIDPANGDLMIRTLEGDMRVSPGDFIIRGVQGEFYPCKPGIFAETYEVVEP